ncbi:hypothetical protein A3K48_04570 [candidate division WOR-1 bacterium RIFOXYA12_FULL_52_29]|uniref:Uncharacterized protein n=1 Tax=candidate division WOR-1 bacterium RIFOXYC12_FULL_54_18 TaxID=1802584 RepID=A0A1F4T6U6_UNCSA|nr:MAG: hypothetical protein A3K44_04570 [candidate division WOR-1 bacterium RIFOXYA2_FULL_51_19]OGC17822.1 MAG: hypothetical protein A3K48_04570 [candidate division WOR-1 bacterium RIFOXYA12_FULL_52_29]OGC26679.1 MAG: hypothetical protein A3K32_04565 [candidate division WOR-1 bacterium RIFOXYB2_FULL_45_9]OGC28239.1 MAG: hypothetical protein A3K49_04570 [candidate division WOR-1 bacterium RIFOXYC12_FULL_54_18]OGC29473.1 MAG: hypothetical protein A2346_01765 [candidate division WOR-1 bacterium R
MASKKPIFAGFGKPGEQVAEKQEIYYLSGKGTDLGCVLLVQEEIKNPSLLELEVKGHINKGAAWSRLRVEVFDKESQEIPATSFEEEYLMEGLSPDYFKRLDFPILGIVKHPFKVQVMIVGPSEAKLEIRNVHLR